jgi:hypothetical protein
VLEDPQGGPAWLVDDENVFLERERLKAIARVHGEELLTVTL